MKVAIQGRLQGAQADLYKAAGFEVVEGSCRNEDEMIEPVSYTHMTLPTISIV